MGLPRGEYKRYLYNEHVKKPARTARYHKQKFKERSSYIQTAIQDNIHKNDINLENSIDNSEEKNHVDDICKSEENNHVEDIDNNHNIGEQVNN
jgi:hypothetical protein